MAVAVSRHHIRNLAYNPNIYCFDEKMNIHHAMISLYLRRNNSINARIETIVNRAFEAGLFVKWQSNGRFQSKKIVKDPIIALRIEHIYASIFIYLVSILLCLILFMMELCAANQMTRPKPHRFWIYMYRFIDGRRRFLFFEQFSDRTITSSV